MVLGFLFCFFAFFLFSVDIWGFLFSFLGIILYQTLSNLENRGEPRLLKYMSNNEE